MKKITVNKLWAETAKVLAANKSILLKNYGDRKKYTKKIIDILMKLGPDLDFNPDKEYWPRVDISYFDKCTDDNWEEWAREVAIELENDETWYRELDKLFAINAGIKMLIAYDNRSDEEILELLNDTKKGSFKSIYLSRKYHQKNDQYILIFGPFDFFGKRKDLSAFLFNGEKTIKMKEYKILQN